MAVVAKTYFPEYYTYDRAVEGLFELVREEGWVAEGAAAPEWLQCARRYAAVGGQNPGVLRGELEAFCAAHGPALSAPLFRRGEDDVDDVDDEFFLAECDPPRSTPGVTGRVVYAFAKGGTESAALPVSEMYRACLARSEASDDARALPARFLLCLFAALAKCADAACAAALDAHVAGLCATMELLHPGGGPGPGGAGGEQSVESVASGLRDVVASLVEVRDLEDRSLGGVLDAMASKMKSPELREKVAALSAGAAPAFASIMQDPSKAIGAFAPLVSQFVAMLSQPK